MKVCIVCLWYICIAFKKDWILVLNHKNLLVLPIKLIVFCNLDILSQTLSNLRLFFIIKETYSREKATNRLSILNFLL